MRYDIYHHNDFDGVASAAVIYDFLSARHNTVGKMVPLDYNAIRDYVRSNFFSGGKKLYEKNHASIVVDFAYHPKATMWFDHHPTPFKKKEWKEKFVADPGHYVNASYHSCCHLIVDRLKKHFGYKPRRHIRELARWADIIDSALYKSPRQTIYKKDPAIMLAAVVEAYGEKKIPYAQLIKDISALPLREVLAMPRNVRIVKTIQKEISKSLDFYKKKTRLCKAAAFVDESALRSISLRFAPLAIFPRASYVVRVYDDPPKSDTFHISLSINPWKKTQQSIHIGFYMRKLCDGGGHKCAGGCMVNGKKQMNNVVEKILQAVNE